MHVIGGIVLVLMLIVVGVGFAEYKDKEVEKEKLLEREKAICDAQINTVLAELNVRIDKATPDDVRRWVWTVAACWKGIR